MFATFSSVPVISISNSQRRPVPQAGWVKTIYHGVPAQLLTPQPVKPSYLAFLGRISPEKCVDRAIRIAERAGLPIKIAAKIDKVDRDYFEEQVKPLMSLPFVDYIGEINDAQKPDFLSGAIALLVTIDWPEPFGLVMIEAMACGTPVIAFNRGSVLEIIDDGLTGYIVEDDTSAVAAVGRLSALSRQRVTSALRGALYCAPHGQRILGRLPQSHRSGRAAPSLGDGYHNRPFANTAGIARAAGDAHTELHDVEPLGAQLG
jgi:glycosyltransferase involved in cell wall biosynthesis